MNATEKRIKTTLYLRANIQIVNKWYFLSSVLNSLSRQLNFKLFFYFENTEYDIPFNNHSLICIHPYFCKLSSPKVPKLYLYQYLLVLLFICYSSAFSLLLPFSLIG